MTNQVNTIAQDKQGFIWVGTTDGLQRYDGIRFKSFQHHENDSASLPSEPVWQLLVDKRNNLWVLLASGRVGIFDEQNARFHEVPATFRNPVSPNTFLKKLISDDSGNVFYLISGSELITWDEKSRSFSYRNNFVPFMASWRIIDFIQEPGTAKYWFSIDHGGLGLYDRSSGMLSHPGSNVQNIPVIDKASPSKNYNRLFFDRQQRLWCTVQETPVYVQCFDLHTGGSLLPGKEFMPQIRASYDIKGFLQQSDGSIWATGRLVFARFDEKKKKFRPVYNGYENDRSISYEMIHSFVEDREQNLWVATDNNGIYRFNPAMEVFTNFSHNNPKTGKTGEARLTSFASTRWGNILAATLGDGIFEYDRNLNPVPLDIKGLENRASIWCMTASADSHTIWIGAIGEIIALNEQNRRITSWQPPIFAGDGVRQLAEDRNGNLWIGMQNTGLFRWNARDLLAGNIRGIQRCEAVPLVPVNKITVDSRGLIWVGTPETGLFVLDPAKDSLVMQFSKEAPAGRRLTENGISSILEYDDSLVLISTSVSVMKYNRLANEISRVSASSEKISGFIAAMEKDRRGFIWLTSTNGLYRINIQKKIFLIFNRDDGFNNEQFGQSSSGTLPDGRLLFGTTNNFISFDPNRIHRDSIIREVRITGLKAGNNILSVDSVSRLAQLELSYKDNSLEVEFSPLLYSYAFLIKYKMEGLDKTWKVSDRSFRAVYSYLPPGDYTLMLRFMDSEGNEYPDITRLAIRIVPPFWRTIWFYSLIALAFAAVLFWLDRERMKRKEAEQKMRSDIADNLHQDVNVALSNINILSEMANLKAGREPEKSREYIEQINFKSQTILLSMDDMLWSIKPENDSMDKVIERIREHIDGLKVRFDTEIRLLVDKKARDLRLNMILRKNILWLFKGGSTNIVRSGARDCNIHIGLQRQHLVYTVEFNSTTMNMQQMNNLLQRQELAEKLKEVNAVIHTRFQSTRSEIELMIPVG